VVSTATTDDELLKDFSREVDLLIENKDNDEDRTPSRLSHNCNNPPNNSHSFPLPTTTLIIVTHMFTTYPSQVSMGYKLMDHLTSLDLTSPETNPKSLTIVNFHPQASHSLYSITDGTPTDYSIRSPYPTIHILRESDILKVIQEEVHPNPEDIPHNNSRKLEGMGIEKVKALWKDVGVS